MGREKLHALNGEWAVVTGASSGIGRAYAVRLAELGYDLLLTGRRKDALEGTALRCGGVQVELLLGDLQDVWERKRLLERIAELPRIGFIVNNAGFGTPARFMEMDVELIDGMIDVMTKLMADVCRVGSERMDGRGWIVNVGSIAGLMRTPQNPIYSSTKAFVNTFSENLQHHIADRGIKVQALCPGFTYTDFHSRDGFEDFQRDSVPAMLWMEPAKVVEISLKRLRGRRIIVVPGMLNRLMVWVYGSRFRAKWLFGLRRLFYRKG